MPSWPPRIAALWSTLSARIRWLILVASLPAAALVVHQASEHRLAGVSAAQERAQLTLRAVVAGQERLIQYTQDFLGKLATLPQVHDPSQPACGVFWPRCWPCSPCM